MTALDIQSAPFVPFWWPLAWPLTPLVAGVLAEGLMAEAGEGDVDGGCRGGIVGRRWYLKFLLDDWTASCGSVCWGPEARARSRQNSATQVKMRGDGAKRNKQPAICSKKRDHHKERIRVHPLTTSFEKTPKSTTSSGFNSRRGLCGWWVAPGWCSHASSLPKRTLSSAIHCYSRRDSHCLLPASNRQP